MHLPKIFQVNWFRRGDDGRFLWPGFGENLRVLEWILGRCEDRVGAQDTPIGLLPRAEDLNLEGIDVREGDLAELLAVDVDAWREELEAVAEHLYEYEPRTPAALKAEQQRIATALGQPVALDA